MKIRVTIISLFLTVACLNCLGQSSFMGFTPGKSTRADVERVLGVPQSKTSETLSEYKAPSDKKKYVREDMLWSSAEGGLVKIYVQYRDGSPAAVIVRIELICETTSYNSCSFGEIINDPAGEKLARTNSGVDAMTSKTESTAENFYQKFQIFHGAPVYVVNTTISKIKGSEPSSSEARWGLYSKKLYEDTVPQGDCIGAFVGQWETTRGRVNGNRDPGSQTIRGTYSTNNGTFTGKQMIAGVIGEWKDSTGSGTMDLHMLTDNDQIRLTGKWKRTTGKGPPEGVWEGRCVATAGGPN